VTLKELERAWKAVSLRAACRLMGALPTPEVPPTWGRIPTRILFLRQDRIGDAIVSSGLLRALKEGVPGLTIDALASPQNAAVLQREPSIDVVHVFDKRRYGDFASLTRRFRERRYEAVIDCMVTAPSMTGLLLMIASGARHRIGIAGRGVDAALTIPVPAAAGAVHIIDLLAPLVVPFAIDTATTDFRPSIRMTPEELAEGERRWSEGGPEGGRRLLVNLSAGRPDRSWRDEHFVYTVRRVRDRYPELRVSMVGAPSEWERVQRVAEEAGVASLRTPRLDDVMALVATADLVFTPDTSIGHMAAAFRKPALVLYRTPEAAAQWGLYRSPGVALTAPGGSFAALSPAPVEAELQRLVGVATEKDE
jgi:ADP-heptose:LPS heptosyltransferase